MIELVDVNINEFKKLIYPEYKKLFPRLERKTYSILKKIFSEDILKIYKIEENDDFIGFMMTNSLKSSKYIQLDYFAILPQYQNKGYGTKALKLLKDKFKVYNGIFIEIEKLGLGKNDHENILRKKRKKFYEKIGFCKLNFELDLYKVIYTPYVLYTSSIKEDDNEILEDIFNIYNKILGDKRVNKNCKILYN